MIDLPFLIDKNAIARNITGSFSLNYQTSGNYVGNFYCENNSISTLKLLMNSYYFFHSISIKSSIPEDIFIKSQSINYPLNLTFRYSHNKENILSSPFYFNSFLDNYPYSRYFFNTHKNTNFEIKLNNPLLNVIDETLKYDTIKINITILLYEIYKNELKLDYRI